MYFKYDISITYISITTLNIVDSAGEGRSPINIIILRVRDKFSNET